MAEFARSIPQDDISERIQRDREPANASAIVKLALLHAEAEETARLANLLGRTWYVAVALPVLAVLALAFAEPSPTRAIVWGAFVAAGSAAILRCYYRTIDQSFERVALRAFAKDLSPILLYAGFAWGAGAFLVLPAGTTMAAAILFVAVPAIMIAALLRVREAAYLFLAPATFLASFASVLMPFADGALAAGLILIASGAITVAMVYSERGKDIRPAMLTLP